MLSRRRFAQNAASGIALSAVAPTLIASRRRDTSVPPQFFIYVQITGAWDPCLAVDPKDRDARMPNGDRQFDQPYAMNEVREYANGIRLAPHGLALAPFVDRMTIINGIDMQFDNGHIPDAIMSGFQSPRSKNLPFLQNIVAKRHPYLRTCSLPHLYAAYDGMYFEGAYGGLTITSTAADFCDIVAPSDRQGPGLEIVEEMVAEHRDAQDSLDRRRAFTSYAEAVDRGVYVVKRLRDSGFQRPETTRNPADLGKLFGQLFAAGVLGSATISTNFQVFNQSYFFDTHSNHYAEHPLKNLLQDITAMCNALNQVKLDENTSVMERTTVFITAEYSRTPRLNNSQGKDHNFSTNSAIIFGHRAKPGMFGCSGARQEASGWSGHAGLPIDFATGLPKADGKILNANHLWAGLGGIVGADLSHEFGSDTLPITFLG